MCITKSPKLSIILIAYNMRREIPRTLLSLSPQMQFGIDASDYEIILIDNGSSEPFDHDVALSQSPNVRIVTINDASVSPAPAINRGIREARGAVISVMIDGARMASPRLLSLGLSTVEITPRSVVGTIAFHLGPNVQMESVKQGYNQQVEDDLLHSVNWQSDGYRLFEISALAGSSSGGWLELPHESNAIFLPKQLWEELGGYDENFRTPGGGLVNLDTWERACALSDVDVFQLLGEATFHQFHGGVATNSPTSKWDLFHDEFKRVRGRNYSAPVARPTLIGQLRNEASKSPKFFGFV